MERGGCYDTMLCGGEKEKEGGAAMIGCERLSITKNPKPVKKKEKEKRNKRQVIIQVSPITTVCLTELAKPICSIGRRRELFIYLTRELSINETCLIFFYTVSFVVTYQVQRYFFFL